MITPIHSPAAGRAFISSLVFLLALAAGTIASAQTNVKSGFGTVVLENQNHPNGNVYDQVLMTGPTVTIAADPGQVVRVSFLDENEDIVQVEFAGAGSVTVELDPDTYRGAALPARYNQNVRYVQGRPTIRVQNATADSFLTVFSVGRANAVNPTLFPAGMTYDAMADVRLIEVHGAEMGAILTGNVRYGAPDGATGIQAPDTAVRHRVVVGELTAGNLAVPLLRLGSGSPLQWDGGAVLVAGGRLLQGNRTPIDVGSGAGTPLTAIRSVAGRKSNDEMLPAAALQAQFASRNAGGVLVNGIAQPTRGYVPESFDELLAEAGFEAFDFGAGTSTRFSGGNNGTYTVTGDTWVEGDAVHFVVSGSYSYSAGGANRNVMTFSVTFDRVYLRSGGVVFDDTVQHMAELVEEVLPARIMAVADFASAVSGTATMTVRYTDGSQDVAGGVFDLDRELDFQFL